MCSSYAWDTAIAFIQNTNFDYGSSSEEGNYKNSPTFSYKDLNNDTQEKTNGTTKFIPTGQTTPVCNIYDMGGNVWEWTTELYSRGSYPYTQRGGFCHSEYANIPAGVRVGHSNRYKRGCSVFVSLCLCKYKFWMR